MSAKRLAVIVGAGPGLGAALGRAFAKSHAVALVSRSAGPLEKIRDSITSAGGAAEAFPCDVSNASSIVDLFDKIKVKFPDHAVDAAVYNVNWPFIMKPFLELTDQDMKPGVDVGFYGAMNFSKAVLPLMLSHTANGTDPSKHAALLFTGATAAMRGGAKRAALAPAKFAQRALAQSLAREFGPMGVHVAHVIVDGIIDTENVRKKLGEPSTPGAWLDTDDLANEYLKLYQQPRSTWTQELDLRPFCENF